MSGPTWSDFPFSTQDVPIEPVFRSSDSGPTSTESVDSGSEKMNIHTSDLFVTLSPELLEKLQEEADLLGVALEWLVASLVYDTMETTPLCLSPVAA